ncbi:MULTISPECIES: SRPBCC domain-containing protein [unclassified Flavobacterium]|uniref:SRPBCC family protein n=1 Tax=unclassified Flavobacterium TaxID=196869 RepID=UPI00095EAAC7|nr:MULTISPECIES: SRPBCC domain-containing protein [unclassified Flavobacterium]MBN9283701.1 SRPBCC domain-containing protein [Flavobacterium sp.]OJV68790.1 MAG: hypothetical protein BGO42_02870 [Flavobacterium sp. 40-81]
MDFVTVSQTFQCTVEELWNALTQEEQLKEWYFPVQDFLPEVGHTFTFYESEKSKKYLHRCRFFNIIPYKLLEHTWEHPGHSKGISRLKWELLPLNDSKTLLTLTHTDLQNFADAGPDFSVENYRMGWEAILNTSLKKHLDKFTEVP